MFKSYRIWLALVALLAQCSLALAVSNGPLEAITAYIDGSGTCAADFIEWNRKYAGKAMAGETSREFYYRALNNQNWGQCGRPYFRPIFNELQRAWAFFSRGLVTEAQFEAKETELINLFFAALADDSRGAQMVQTYEARIAVRLINLNPPRQYSNCTFFDDQLRCMF